MLKLKVGRRLPKPKTRKNLATQFDFDDKMTVKDVMDVNARVDSA
jgi:hypothetical protein